LVVTLFEREFVVVVSVERLVLIVVRSVLVVFELVELVVFEFVFVEFVLFVFELVLFELVEFAALLALSALTVPESEARLFERIAIFFSLVLRRPNIVLKISEKAP